MTIYHKTGEVQAKIDDTNNFLLLCAGMVSKIQLIVNSLQ
jgi:hypothetical protein